MITLGMKSDVVGKTITNLQPIYIPFDKVPTTMPSTWDGQKVVCGFDQGSGEKMIVVETLEEMQTLFRQYEDGYAFDLHWYTATVAAPSIDVFLKPSNGLTYTIITDLAKDLSPEVKLAIYEYASGNVGVAKALIEKAQSLSLNSVEQIEKLVGWPVSENTPERVTEIWDRLKK